LKPWDIAAGLLMVRESGGYATDLDGAHGLPRSGDVIAANDHLHTALIQLMREALHLSAGVRAN